MKSRVRGYQPILATGRILFILSLYLWLSAWPAVCADNASPPAETVKLVFVHHSCGENWLTDGNGNLGRALGNNNYYVSDTNYGWGPHGIGDNTDITDWPRWFAGRESGVYLNALYRESGQHSTYTRTSRNPGGENRIILFNGDDHPSPKGNRKATDEIVPLINLYYHRWRAGQGSVQPAGMSSTPEQPITQNRTSSAETVPAPLPIQRSAKATAGTLIDDFEQAVNEWVVFADEGNSATQLSCRREVSEDFRGQAGLGITYTVAPESWATCSLVLPAPEDWRPKRGISLYLRSEQPEQEVHIVAYQGASADNLSHFEYTVMTTAETVSGWQRVDIPWNAFMQASWEGDGTAKFDPGRAMGLAFAFNGGEGGDRAGKIWVDDICFLSK